MVLLYEEKSDSLQLVYVAIFSLKFDNIYQSDDTTYYSGQITSYYLDSFGVGEEYLKNGEILLAKDEKWVLLQNTELNSISNSILLKQNSNFIDTTANPSDRFNQYPVYPQNLEARHEYSVFRPGNEQFYKIKRKFKTYDYQVWKDSFGTEKGIEIKEIMSDNLSNEISSQATIDEHGVIISQNSYLD